jgi:uroporphyrinogen-III synthase
LEAAGFETRRSVLYEAKAVEALSPLGQKALSEGIDGVLFFSPRTAALFRERVRAAGLAPTLAPATAYCLSPAVAEAAAGLPWTGVAVAEHPETPALLALIGG